MVCLKLPYSLYSALHYGRLPVCSGVQEHIECTVTALQCTGIWLIDAIYGIKYTKLTNYAPYNSLMTFFCIEL